MRLATCAAIAALALPAAAFAQTKAELDLYDINGDGYISDLEFSQNNEASGRRAAVDSDGDGMISREEFDRSEFLRADLDGDGRISADEYDAFR